MGCGKSKADKMPRTTVAMNKKDVPKDATLLKEPPAEEKAAEGVAPAAGAPATATDLVALFGDKLVAKDGSAQTKDVVAGKTHIMIYFSAHWCPPCRAFTPTFAQAYKDSAKAGKDVAVIFASSDRDQASFDAYYGEMPWHALPFSESATKEKLSKKFEVNGIPMLIILDAKGNLITSQGRGEYQKYLAGEPTAVAETPKVEEPVAAVAEAPKAEEPVAAVAETPKVEEPAAAVAETRKAEEPAAAVAAAPPAVNLAAERKEKSNCC